VKSKAVSFGSQVSLARSDIFFKMETTPLVVVPATHIKMGLAPAIPDLPEKCLSDKTCDHPAIDSITKHLKGRSIASIVPTLKNYRVGLYFTNFSKQSVMDNEIKLKIVKAENSKIKTIYTKGQAEYY
jgi:hypothetical protein